MPLEQPFSKRHHYSSGVKEITIREDAPQNLRYFILMTAQELDLRPSELRDIICKVLRKPPNQGNWSDYPNIWGEVQDLVYECDWFKVYDIIEALYPRFTITLPFDPVQEDPFTEFLNESLKEEGNSRETNPFGEALNEFFLEEGIGWQLVDGYIVTRGTEAFEMEVKQATAALKASERPTAAKHIHEALQDLSRRPEADLPGAVYHAMGSLECVARDLTGDSKATLGETLKRHADLLPKPLDSALSQIWGYASNVARHVQEGRETSREEAELMVGLSATLCTYLTRKKL